MKKKLIRICATLMVVITLVSVLAATSSAYVAFNSYNFNYYGEPVWTPSGYSHEEIYYAEDLGIDTLENAVDIFVSTEYEDKNLVENAVPETGVSDDGSTTVQMKVEEKLINRIYILSYGTVDNEARIHVYDDQFNLIKVINKLHSDIEANCVMKSPKGLAVDKDGYIYVCDTGNQRILRLNNKDNTKIDMVVNTPKADIFSEKFQFNPAKIAIAKNKSLYVISEGTLDGIMEFSKDGVFLRYFGAPEVKLSVMDMVTMSWRRIYRSILGSSADDTFVTFVPTEFVNLVVDKHGFVYSVISAAGGENTDQLKKLNFLGNNILDPTAKSTQKKDATHSATYGDLVRRSSHGQGNVFKDVIVDEDGFITMLDTNLRKIFEYDEEGNMTFVYSTLGEQEGLLKNPVAFDKLGKKTLVLDSGFGSLVVYDLTKHGRTLHDAVILYNEGKYDQAEELWLEVLKNDANCELAHIGIGKVYYQNSRYADAMEHFKLANDRKNYESAFALYREQVIADQFGLIMTVIVALIVFWIVWKLFGNAIKTAIKERKQGGVEDNE